MSADDHPGYLELSPQPILFETDNESTSVFFDDSNKQIFTVRTGNGVNISVKGPKSTSLHQNFRVQKRDDIVSVKFSPDGTILAIQRTKTSVDFGNYEILPNKLSQEYTQNCRKNSNIHGFAWISRQNHICFITDNGVETYHVQATKKTVKPVKYLTAISQWYLWNRECNMAILASGNGAQLQPVTFKDGVPAKLPVVELGLARTITKCDVTLAYVNAAPAILVLNHGDKHGKNAEVSVYQSSSASQTMKLTHVLQLGVTDFFAINVIDNFICVHHRDSKKSSLFDIAHADQSVHVQVVVKHKPTVTPRAIRPAKTMSFKGQEVECELYSANWVVFQPNIIIDKRLGCLWYLNVDVKAMAREVHDLETCVRILRRCPNGKDTLLDVLRGAIKDQHPLASRALDLAVHVPNETYIELDQNAIYANVFRDLEPDASLLIAYVRTLRRKGEAAQHHLSELLVTTLVRRGELQTLFHLMRCGAVCDSKPLACLLLSLGNLDVTFTQLALDMMCRLSAVEEIQEVLFSADEVVAAAKFVANCELKQKTTNVMITPPNPRKFLEATRLDANLYHTFYRNYRSKLLNHHVDYYDQIFKHYYDSGVKCDK